MSPVSAAEIFAEKRIAVFFARRYARMGLSMSDLVAEGMLALSEAASRFDPTKGAKFSTYAAYWVRHHLKAYAESTLHAVRRPTHKRSWRLLDKEMKPTTKALTISLGRDPTEEEIAAAIGVSAEDVHDVITWSRSRDSGISEIYGEGHWPVDDAPLPDEAADDARERARLKTALAEALEALPARERFVVEGRAYADEPKTLAAIGRELGVSRERARQLEAQAFARLRRALESFAPTSDEEAA